MRISASSDQPVEFGSHHPGAVRVGIDPEPGPPEKCRETLSEVTAASSLVVDISGDDLRFEVHFRQPTRFRWRQ
jgi:hypothetical protein